MKYADVKVDRCTACKGWWLDAGELEQLTTREDSGWFSRLWQTLSSERE
ncbi:MAG: zf-TFIIB domain-containing protein [Pyrinomonadaceae bacterium]|nr:zf-TFIIB domain-containing protein [Pyrinomonadaceae bacterium]